MIDRAEALRQLHALMDQMDVLPDGFWQIGYPLIRITLHPSESGERLVLVAGIEVADEDEP